MKVISQNIVQSGNSRILLIYRQRGWMLPEFFIFLPGLDIFTNRGSFLQISGIPVLVSGPIYRTHLPKVP